MAGKSLYETLGVEPNASADEIRSAYRKLARKFHPDVNPDNPDAEAKFKEINEAHSTLSDPEKRAAYDQYGTTDGQPQDPFFGGGGGGGFGDIFDMFFGGGGQGRGRSQGIPGEDLRIDVDLELKDVISEQERTVRFRKPVKCESCTGTGAEGGTKPDKCGTCGGSGSVNRTQQTFLGAIRTSTPCPTCRGIGEVIKNPCKACRGRGLTVQEVEKTITVPAGVQDGQSMLLRGEGGEGLKGGSAGDLGILINVIRDNRFERDGVHLQTALEVTFPQATLGDQLTFDGLDSELVLDVPAGTQPGSVFRVKNAGVPPLHGGTRGDLFVEIHVKVPEKLSEAEEKLIRELAMLQGTDLKPQGGFLGGLFKKK